jgi:hypothetical protein
VRFEQRSHIPKEMRREILEYYLDHGRMAMKAHYDISEQAAGHLIFHDKRIIEQIEDERFEKAGL